MRSRRPLLGPGPCPLLGKAWELTDRFIRVWIIGNIRTRKLHLVYYFIVISEGWFFICIAYLQNSSFFLNGHEPHAQWINKYRKINYFINNLLRRKEGVNFFKTRRFSLYPDPVVRNNDWLMLVPFCIEISAKFSSWTRFRRKSWLWPLRFTFFFIKRLSLLFYGLNTITAVVFKVS